MNNIIKLALCLILSYVLSLLGYVIAAKVVAFLAIAVLVIKILFYILFAYAVLKEVAQQEERE